MFKLIYQLVVWLRGETLKLLMLAVVILLAWGIVSPVGTLMWGFEQGADILGVSKTPHHELPLNNGNAQKTNPESGSKFGNIDCYIVFLPGVGDFSTDELTPGEATFIDSLVQKHHNCVAVRDVFPYSVANKGLGAPRLLAPVWRFAHEASEKLKLASVLIKIRNLWRFAISADSRYGRIYNLGIASAIVDRMNAAHPIPPSSSQPLKILLIGTSGGVEVAQNAASYLKQWLDAKIDIISIGGVFDGKNGFNAIEHFYHLRGRRDWVEDIGGIIFPSRWKWNIRSPFNQARLQDRYTAITSGPHTHDGAESYFDEKATIEDGTSYVDLTIQKVNQLISL